MGAKGNYYLVTLIYSYEKMRPWLSRNMSVEAGEGARKSIILEKLASLIRGRLAAKFQDVGGGGLAGVGSPGAWRPEEEAKYRRRCEGDKASAGKANKRHRFASQ